MVGSGCTPRATSSGCAACSSTWGEGCAPPKRLVPRSPMADRSSASSAAARSTNRTELPELVASGGRLADGARRARRAGRAGRARPVAGGLHACRHAPRSRRAVPPGARRSLGQWRDHDHPGALRQQRDPWPVGGSCSRLGGRRRTPSGPRLSTRRAARPAAADLRHRPQSQWLALWSTSGRTLRSAR